MEREGKGQRAQGEMPGSEVMQKGEIRGSGSGGALDGDCGRLTAGWGAGLRWCLRGPFKTLFRELRGTN